MAIVIVYLISVSIPLIIGIYGYRRLKIDMKLLLALIVLAFCVEVLTFCMSWEKIDTVWVHNIYLPFEYILIALIFSKWHDNVKFGKLIIYSIPVYILLHILSQVRMGDINQINSFSISLSCTLFVCISAYTLLILLKADIGSIYQDYKFWACSALLIYAAGSIAFWAFSKIIISFILYYIFLCVNAVAYFLFAAAFWIHFKHQLPSAPDSDLRVE